MGGSGSSEQKKEESETESRVINEQTVFHPTMNQVSIHGSTLLASVALGLLLMLAVMVTLKCLSRRGCFNDGRRVRRLARIVRIKRRQFR